MNPIAGPSPYRCSSPAPCRSETHDLHLACCRSPVCFGLACESLLAQRAPLGCRPRRPRYHSGSGWTYYPARPAHELRRRRRSCSLPACQISSRSRLRSMLSTSPVTATRDESAGLSSESSIAAVAHPCNELIYDAPAVSHEPPAFSTATRRVPSQRHRLRPRGPGQRASSERSGTCTDSAHLIRAECARYPAGSF